MKNRDILKKAPWLTAIALGLVLGCASSGFAADSAAKAKSCSLKNKTTATASTTASAAENKKALSYKFVVSSKTATIKKLDGHRYTLTMKRIDINHVIEFSDRPNRIVKYIKGSELQEKWTEGKNSFAENPPNAVLSATNQKPVIVVLGGVHVKKTAVTFYVSATASTPHTILNNVTLSIDDWSQSNGGKGVCCYKFICPPPS